MANGDARVTLKAEPIERSITVRCVIVDKLAAEKDRLEVVLRPEEGSKALDPLALTIEGPAGVEEIPVRFESDNPAVLGVGEGGGMTVKGFGKATLNIAVADKELNIPVEIGRVLREEQGLVIEDDEGHGITLEPGRYRAVVSGDQELRVAFQGTHCESDEDAEQHVLECRLEKAGALRVENPGLLGMGSGDATVSIEVIELP